MATAIGALYLGWGAYIGYDATRAAMAWRSADAQHKLVATGLFTDLVQRFVGPTGAIMLEATIGSWFVIAGILVGWREVRKHEVRKHESRKAAGSASVA